MPLNQKPNQEPNQEPIQEVKEAPKTLAKSCREYLGSFKELELKAKEFLSTNQELLTIKQNDSVNSTHSSLIISAQKAAKYLLQNSSKKLEKQTETDINEFLKENERLNKFYSDRLSEISKLDSKRDVLWQSEELRIVFDERKEELNKKALDILNNDCSVKEASSNLSLLCDTLFKNRKVIMSSQQISKDFAVSEGATSFADAIKQKKYMATLFIQSRINPNADKNLLAAEIIARNLVNNKIARIETVDGKQSAAIPTSIVRLP
ncbi:MAG: hypothetical protein LBM38_00300 [Clostridiales bacterium]|jgi:hypothetical protein|nr:hypothetical protein [Clostridiales bacterium]